MYAYTTGLSTLGILTTLHTQFAFADPLIESPLRTDFNIQSNGDSSGYIVVIQIATWLPIVILILVPIVIVIVVTVKHSLRVLKQDKKLKKKYVGKNFEHFAMVIAKEIKLKLSQYTKFIFIQGEADKGNPLAKQYLEKLKKKEVSID